MPKKYIACCGSVIQDLFLFSNIAAKGSLEVVQKIGYSLGGPVCNTSIGLSKLGQKVEAVGIIGLDESGQKLKKKLESEGVKTSGIKKSLKSDTGISVIIVTPDGERTIYFCAGANEEFSLSFIDNSNFDNWAICHFGYPSILPNFNGSSLSSFFRKLKQNNVVTCLDTSWSSPGNELSEIEEALKYTDIFTPNLSEALQLAKIHLTKISLETLQEVSEFFLIKGVKVIIITLGNCGCYCATQQEFYQSNILPTFGIRLYSPSYLTSNEINTTGAGDFFVAGLLAAFLKNESPEYSLKAANLVAALHIEGITIPHYKELKYLLEERTSILPDWNNNQFQKMLQFSV